MKMRYWLLKALFFLRSKVVKCTPKYFRNILKKTQLVQNLKIRESGIDEKLICDWVSQIKESSRLKNRINEFPPGINLIGCFRSMKGISQSVRAIARSLNFSTIPHSIVNVDFGLPLEQLTEKTPSPEDGFKYSVNLFSINPPEMPYLYGHFSKKQLIRGWSIGYWYWELEQIPLDWRFALDIIDEIWVASNFQKQNFQRATTKPVYLIPPSVDIDYYPVAPRSNFNLPNNQFIFMCACETSSSIERKNPFGVIKAFKQAFTGNPNAGLVVKIYDPFFNSSQMKKIHDEINGLDNIYLITKSLSRIEMLSLLAVVDAYVSLHRAEGFGLIPAEAMALGKPVIMTRWSGNTDMMNDENSIAIDYELVPILQDQGPYKAGELWAEPDLNQSVEWMRILLNDPDICREKGEQARTSIKELYSPEVIGRKITQRFQEIGI